MERLDKIIGTQTEYSRKDVKKLISQKRKGKAAGEKHPFYGKHHTKESL